MFAAGADQQTRGMAKTHRITATLVMLFVVACSDAAPPPAGDPQPIPSPEADQARALFWQTFRTEDLAQAAEATRALQEVYDAQPQHANNTLLLGLSLLWQLSEAERMPNLSQSQIPTLAFSSLTALQEARALAPNDHRIYSWLGPVMYGTALGTGNEEMAAQAVALLDEGVELYPEFNLFTRAQQNSLAPLNSPQWAQALDDMWRSVELCIGQKVEREPAEIMAFINQNAADAPSACGNSPLADHNTEGFLLFFADLLSKAGETELARTTLEALPQVPSYDAWPYRHLVDERLMSLDARVMRFQNGDPSDDPRLIAEAPYNCSYCHADEGSR